TQVAPASGQPSRPDNVVQVPAFRRAKNPFCVTAQTLPLRSSQIDCTDIEGRPDSIPSSLTTRGCSRLRPPPAVPTHMLPSWSSHRLRIWRWVVGTLSNSEPL